jgi:hypothetical protein
MKEYIVWQEYVEWRGFKVEANSPEEAKEIYLSEGFDCDEHECGQGDGRWGEIEVEEY